MGSAQRFATALRTVRALAARAHWRPLLVGGLLAAALPLLGCRGMPSPYPPIHLNQNMDNQERYDPQQASDFFYDGMAMRQPVAGAVARGQLDIDHRVTFGRDDEGHFLARSPLPVDEAVLARGRNRYAIYCQPCHDERGTGQGILFERAGTPTTSLHDERVVTYDDGRIYDIVTNGSGLMAGYRYPLDDSDRWAIVAYVRALQEERQAMQDARAQRQQ